MSKRRGNGEGSVFQRKDGRWCARISLGRGPDGRRRYQSFYAKTRADAAGKLTDELAEQRKGKLPADPSRFSTGEYLEVWLADVPQSVRSSTAVSYGDHLRRHVIPTLNRIPLRQLGKVHIKHLYATLAKAGASGRARQYAHDLLRMALSEAVTLGLIPMNPTDKLKRPQAMPRTIPVLTAEQVHALLEAASGTRLGALVTLCVTAGLRQGEALGLPWSAVELAHGRVHVRQQLLRGRTKGAVPVLGPLKTKKSRRTVELTTIAVTALKAWRARQAAERLKLGPNWPESDLVFTTALGTPLNPSNVRRDFRRLLERAELPRVPWHATRHTACTLMLAAGTNPRLVSEQLGHHDVGFTLSVYGAVFPDRRREGAERMDAVLAAEAAS